MKRFTLLLSHCFGCPDHSVLTDSRVQIDWCRSRGKIIENVAIQGKGLPDWCPLPEAEPKEKKHD